MRRGLLGGAYVRTSILGAVRVRPAGRSRGWSGAGHVIAGGSMRDSKIDIGVAVVFILIGALCIIPIVLPFYLVG